MERIWAPWRMDYIQQVDRDDAGCFLCAAAASKDDDQALVLARSPLGFVLLNKYPYTGGHLMVAPLAHGGNFSALSPETLVDLMRLAQRCVSALERAMHPGGFNVGFNIGRPAGAGLVDHIHLHVVPRWNGDTNFMPVLGDVRVIPETLAATREKLLPFFSEAEH